jgi:hypothetical protein
VQALILICSTINGRKEGRKEGWLAGDCGAVGHFGSHHFRLICSQILIVCLLCTDHCPSIIKGKTNRDEVADKSFGNSFLITSIFS